MKAPTRPVPAVFVWFAGAAAVGLGWWFLAVGGVLFVVLGFVLLALAPRVGGYSMIVALVVWAALAAFAFAFYGFLFSDSFLGLVALQIVIWMAGLFFVLAARTSPKMVRS